MKHQPHFRPLASSGRIALFGLFGIGNLGNESTLWVTLHHIRLRQPRAQLVCICDEVPEFAREMGVTRLPLDPLPVRGSHRLPAGRLRHLYIAAATLVTEPLRLWRAHRMLEGTERLVIVGTGALDDLGVPPWGMPACIARWCQAARIRRAEVLLLAVGAGPIRNRMSRILMTRAVALSSVRTYRDLYSIEYMANLGVTSSDDEVVPDLVFAWPREWLSPWRDALTPPKSVGVGLMAYFGWNVNDDEGRRVHDAYVAKMAQFVGWLVASGYHVRLLIGERDTDARAVRALLETLGPAAVAQAGERLAVPDIDSISDLLREIMLTDVVIATRFHNLVFALASSRPVISIGYSGKFDALMREMRLDDYCQNVEDLDVEQLKRQFGRLTAKHAAAVAIVGERAAAYRERLESLYDVTFPADHPLQTRSAERVGSQERPCQPIAASRAPVASGPGCGGPSEGDR